MTSKSVETIIIGGGIAGLSCARALQDNKRQFLVITPQLGGRILTSKDGNVNYGAYYVMADYKNVKKYVQLGRRITPGMVYFHQRRYTYSLFDKRFFSHFIEFIRMTLLLRKFRKHYEQFKKNCERNSQKEALEKDEFLYDLYNKKATQILKEYHLDNLVQNYLSETIHATTFLPITQLNGFDFLQFSLPLIVPTYEFKLLKDKLTNGYNNKIILDSVNTISHKKGKWLVETKKSKYYATNLVVATPPPVTQRLLKLSKIKKPVNVHMFHLRGTLRKPWKDGEEHVFPDSNSTLALAHQQNGTYLVYSLEKKLQLDRYFKDYKIIKHYHWNPAFNLGGHELLDSKMKENLIIIGDYNICGLEDSFITGMYAANVISKKRKNGTAGGN